MRSESIAPYPGESLTDGASVKLRGDQLFGGGNDLFQFTHETTSQGPQSAHPSSGAPKPHWFKVLV